MNKTALSSLLRIVAIALSVAASFTLPATARTGASASRPVATSVDSCAWDRPGNDPFMGDVVAAVDRYQDIAPEVRERLKARMVRRDYDDVVSIRRDTITGRSKARYGSAIRDMHFGSAKVCGSVSRAAWTAQMQERGLVYCDGGQCILVPTVCRNVSRIARAEVAPAHAEGDEPDVGVPPVASLELLPAPVPVDVSPPEFAIDAGPAADAPPGGSGYGGFGGAAGGGAIGSFASGSGSGSGVANIASTSDRADNAPPTSSTLAGAPISPVPEPETWALMGAGLAALAARRRRRGRANR